MREPQDYQQASFCTSVSWSLPAWIDDVKLCCFYGSFTNLQCLVVFGAPMHAVEINFLSFLRSWILFLSLKSGKQDKALSNFFLKQNFRPYIRFLNLGTGDIPNVVMRIL